MFHAIGSCHGNPHRRWDRFMESLGSFLIFALAFYLMMRFGCGAHMGGHGKHHGQEAKPPDHKDPVCHRKVSPTEGYGLMHSGTLYRFCSRACLDRFEAEPDRYTSKTLEAPK